MVGLNAGISEIVEHRKCSRHQCDSACFADEVTKPYGRKRDHAFRPCAFVQFTAHIYGDLFCMERLSSDSAPAWSTECARLTSTPPGQASWVASFGPPPAEGYTLCQGVDRHCSMALPCRRQRSRKRARISSYHLLWCWDRRRPFRQRR